MSLLALLLFCASAGAATGARWAPPRGAAFNDPTGSIDAQQGLTGRVIAALDHTPENATVRMAMYSFNLSPVANAIVDAHRRGVHVQMVIDNNLISTPVQRLVRVLGDDPNHESFVVLCKGACRGRAGNLHMKVFAFSQTGTVKKVVMTGSANLTRRAEDLQWNDLYTVNWAGGLYDTFVGVFDQLKYDRPVASRWVEWSDGEYSAQFYRQLSGSPIVQAGNQAPLPSEDPVLNRLKSIRCQAVDGTGWQGHTVIRIAMYSWGGTRGKYLADQIASLARRGCNISVILSRPGGGVVRTLRAAGVPIRSADWQYLAGGITNFYSHLKVMALNGTYRGAGTREVWTGSENWSDRSFRNDELSLGIHSASVWWSYLGWFNSMLAHGTHALGVRPTNKP